MSGIASGFAGQNFESGANGLGAIVLAAGFSRRMGCSKYGLPWGKNSVLGHIIKIWQALRPKQLVVVCGPEGSPGEVELRRLDFPRSNCIVNAAPERGMFSSIQTAASWNGWNEDVTQWAIILGDQPQIARATLEELIGLAQENRESICQPARAGRGKHPVILPKEVFRALPGSSAGTLREYLAGTSARRNCFESADAGLDHDLDYPGDYENALKLFQAV